jgi:flavodoxin
VKAVVVYESLYGNTRAVAEAVAEGLAGGAEVQLAEAGDAATPLVEEADLLVVGGPTHIHGMSSNLSRKGATDDAAKKGLPTPNVAGAPLREWLDAIGKVKDVPAAAFDTRADKPKLITGSAEKGIAHRLRRHGYTVVGEESFLVQDLAGPLGEGELERAREWGRALAAG